jgi:hypothetical protein
MKKVVKKGNIKELKNDYNFWKTTSYQFRLETIEEIRKEYNQWKYGTEQGFQRILKVISKA